MAIGAENDAFGDLLAQLAFAAIGHRPDVEREELLGRVDVVPGEGGQIPMVATAVASATRRIQIPDLSFKSTLLLPLVVLVTIVRVRVFARKRAEAPLPAR
jgi:hypothetical protein